MMPHSIPRTAPTTASAAAPNPPARRPACHVVVAALAACSAVGGAAAADIPPGLVADFTRQVQPLLLNKCAAGACHGGASAHAPRFQRAGIAGQFDRGLTLANIAALDEAIRSAGSAAAFLTTISARHPVSGSSRHGLAPLTTAERAVLERWITAAAGRRPAPFAPVNATPLAAAASARPVAVTSVTAAATPPAAPDDAVRPTGDDDAASAPPSAPAKGKPAGTAALRPNRFRAMLDAAANPPPLPPPQEPKGVLLRDAAE